MDILDLDLVVPCSACGGTPEHEAAKRDVDGARDIRPYMPEAAAQMLIDGCLRFGHTCQGDTVESVVGWIHRYCERSILGGQDRDHLHNAVRAAVEAAHLGNMEYVLAGLREAFREAEHHGT